MEEVEYAEPDDFESMNLLDRKYKDAPVVEEDGEVYLCYTKPDMHHIHVSEELSLKHTATTNPKSWAIWKAKYGRRKLHEAYNQRTNFYYKAPAFKVVTEGKLDNIVSRLQKPTQSTQLKAVPSHREEMHDDNRGDDGELNEYKQTKVTFADETNSGDNNVANHDNMDGSNGEKEDLSAPSGEINSSNDNLSVTKESEDEQTGKVNRVKNKETLHQKDQIKKEREHFKSYKNKSATANNQQAESKNKNEEEEEEKQKTAEEMAKRVESLCRGTVTSRIRAASVKYNGKPEYAESVKAYSSTGRRKKSQSEKY